MAEDQLIGLVTVTYNSAEVLPDFLRCTMSQTYSKFKLYAVDNASKDDSLEILRACKDKRLVLLANIDNKGVAEGNNQGIQAAIADGCELILLINNDTEFEPDLTAQLVDGLDRHKVEMISPKILYFDDPERIWAAGGRFDPWLGYRSAHIGENEIDHGQYNKGRLISYVPTCCVLIQKKVFDHIGLMDARYFVYADDTDFMYRAKRAGIRLWYLPEARLLHKVGRLTGGEESPFSIRFGTRNRIFFLLKHFGFALTLPWLLVCQLLWRVRAATKHDAGKWLTLKQNAFREALQMYKERGRDE